MVLRPPDFGMGSRWVAMKYYYWHPCLE